MAVVPDLPNVAASISIATIGEEDLNIHNNIIDKVFGSFENAERRLVVVNFIGSIQATSVPIRLLWNYCRNQFGFNGPNVVFPVDNRNISLWQTIPIGIGTSLIVMHTPCVTKKELFSKALRFSGAFASAHVVCVQNLRQTLTEDLQCIESTVKVKDKIGLGSVYFMMSVPVPPVEQQGIQDAVNAQNVEPLLPISQNARSLGIYALHNIINKLPYEDDQLRIRREFENSGCYFTYRFNSLDPVEQAFVGSVLGNVKTFGGSCLDGTTLLRHYHGPAAATPRKKWKDWKEHPNWDLTELLLLLALMFSEIGAFVGSGFAHMGFFSFLYFIFLTIKTCIRLQGAGYFGYILKGLFGCIRLKFVQLFGWAYEKYSRMLMSISIIFNNNNPPVAEQPVDHMV